MKTDRHFSAILALRAVWYVLYLTATERLNYAGVQTSRTGRAIACGS